MSDFTGLITSEMKQMHADAITEVVRACAVACTLYYGETKWTDCPNCIFSPILNASSGQYEPGGPVYFTGICPWCKGAGRIFEERTLDIQLAPVYDFKQWIPIGVEVGTPNSAVQTLSLLSTFDELTRAKEVVIDTSLPSTEQRFERQGEPQPCGFGQSTIIVTMWERIKN